ncbi:hydroxyacylglutathione hydrolase [Marinomonas sp. A79]|uniref:Hydroxyacylglutathione hydrolase n=1 Tax=Marinomonas vulgaris TaxID=2823372 RepID=A0ABS5HBJ2_9GAMM|nr:hydroxyacylglutathione hydrolase [Marinomonas vulgaris]MBR7889032.1 hydroxyacylglutathione hydrolase [Marinomonas vulgaris]
MTIFPLPAFNDNYIWILQDKDSSAIWAVDPGKAEVVLDYCQQHQHSLKGIIITHHHKDHTGGVAELREQTGCVVYGPKHLVNLVTHPVDDGDSLDIFAQRFSVLATPGHTLDHLCYFSSLEDTATNAPTPESPILFCGDTLFRGGCGRIMEGTPEQMLAAMERIAALPDNTKLYGTHEYTLANYRFALSLEPDNLDLINSTDLCQQWRNRGQVTLPTELSVEKKTNPFLRTHLNSVKNQAAQQLNEIPSEDPVAAFSQVRRAKDSFS